MDYFLTDLICFYWGVKRTAKWLFKIISIFLEKSLAINFTSSFSMTLLPASLICTLMSLLHTHPLFPFPNSIPILIIKNESILVQFSHLCIHFFTLNFAGTLTWENKPYFKMSNRKKMLLFMYTLKFFN